MSFLTASDLVFPDNWSDYSESVRSLTNHTLRTVQRYPEQRARSHLERGLDESQQSSLAV